MIDAIIITSALIILIFDFFISLRDRYKIRYYQDTLKKHGITDQVKDVTMREVLAAMHKL